MARAQYKNWAVDDAGNVQAAAGFEVRTTGGTLVTLYSAETGATTVSNPGTADAEGLVTFWVAPGIYDVTIGAGVSAVTRRLYVDPRYADRAELVTEWSEGLYADGAVISDGVRQYVASTGATAISDLPGLLPYGEARPEHFGVINGTPATDTATLQAFCDHLRDNPNTIGAAIGTYNIGENSITDEGANVDWSRATLQTTASGRSDSLLTIAPHPDDLADADGTLLGIVNAYAAAGDLVPGVRTLANLAPYAGKAIRLRSTQLFIDRDNSATDYRREIFLVPDNEGNLAVPLDMTFPSDTVFTTGTAETLQGAKAIALPAVEITSGSTDNGGALIEVSRSLSMVSAPTIRNATAATQATGLKVCGLFHVTTQGAAITGMNEASTQYGINFEGQAHLFDRCYIASVRRGSDGNYAHRPTFRHCIAPEGIGGHWVFGLNIEGCDVGYDAPNSACVHAAGGAITIDNATTAWAGAGKTIINIRPDVAQCTGPIRCAAKVVFDGTGDSGSPEYTLVNLGRTTGSHDYGSDIIFPDIDLSGMHVEVTGTGHTGEVVAVNLDGTWTATGGCQEIFDATITVKDVTTRFANGAPKMAFQGVRKTWATGAGLLFDVDVNCDVVVYWGAQAGHADPTDARADFYITSKGAVNFRTDGEATHIARIKAASYEASDAVGATSLVGDESWTVAQNGGLPMQWASVADDSVFVVNDLADWGLWALSEDNEPSNAIHARFKTDHVGADGPSILDSGGPFTITRRTGVLTGTTGTDGEISISATGGKIYVENRSGATQALNLMYLGGRGG
jgi:hypothetical protein